MREAEGMVEQFYRAYHVRLFRYAARLLRSPEDAADIVHDAFVRSLPALLGSRPEGEVASEQWPAYLYRTIYHLSLNRLSRGREDATDHAELEQAGPAGDVGELAEHGVDLRRCLGALTVEERAAFLLAFEGFRQREIGEVLGISADAAFRRARAAEAKLRACLTGHGDRA